MKRFQRGMENVLVSPISMKCWKIRLLIAKPTVNQNYDMTVVLGHDPTYISPEIHL